MSMGQAEIRTRPVVRAIVVVRLTIVTTDGHSFVGFNGSGLEGSSRN